MNEINDCNESEAIKANIEKFFQIEECVTICNLRPFLEKIGVLHIIESNEDCISLFKLMQEFENSVSYDSSEEINNIQKIGHDAVLAAFNDIFITSEETSEERNVRLENDCLNLRNEIIVGDFREVLINSKKILGILFSEGLDESLGYPVNFISREFEMAEIRGLLYYFNDIHINPLDFEKVLTYLMKKSLIAIDYNSSIELGNLLSELIKYTNSTANMKPKYIGDLQSEFEDSFNLQRDAYGQKLEEASGTLKEMLITWNTETKLCKGNLGVVHKLVYDHAATSSNIGIFLKETDLLPKISAAFNCFEKCLDITQNLFPCFEDLDELINQTILQNTNSLIELDTCKRTIIEYEKRIEEMRGDNSINEHLSKAYYELNMQVAENLRLISLQVNFEKEKASLIKEIDELNTKLEKEALFSRESLNKIKQLEYELEKTGIQMKKINNEKSQLTMKVDNLEKVKLANHSIKLKPKLNNQIIREWQPNDLDIESIRYCYSQSLKDPEVLHKAFPQLQLLEKLQVTTNNPNPQEMSKKQAAIPLAIFDHKQTLECQLTINTFEFEIINERKTKFKLMSTKSKICYSQKEEPLNSMNVLSKKSCQLNDLKLTNKLEATLRTDKLLSRNSIVFAQTIRNRISKLYKQPLTGTASNPLKISSQQFTILNSKVMTTQSNWDFLYLSESISLHKILTMTNDTKSSYMYSNIIYMSEDFKLRKSYILVITLSFAYILSKDLNYVRLQFSLLDLACINLSNSNPNLVILKRRDESRTLDNDLVFEDLRRADLVKFFQHLFSIMTTYGKTQATFKKKSFNITIEYISTLQATINEIPRLINFNQPCFLNTLNFQHCSKYGFILEEIEGIFGNIYYKKKFGCISNLCFILFESLTSLESKIIRLDNASIQLKTNFSQSNLLFGCKFVITKNQNASFRFLVSNQDEAKSWVYFLNHAIFLNQENQNKYTYEVWI